MNTKELIHNIYIGMNKIGDYSYENFLKSFNFSKEDYSKATEFETRISSLFYFDYCISGKKVNQEFRQKFYEICTEKIRNHYADYFENKNLLDIIDYRYNEYAKIPMSIGENWMQSFNNLYEIKLKGTENVKIIEELPGIKMEDGFQDMPLKMKFIQGEVKNAYRTAKLVDDLFNGKTIYEALYELEQIESKPNPDEEKMNADIDDISELMSTGKIKKKKKEGCYIATVVYGSYEIKEVLILREFRDNILTKYKTGRIFISIYYFTSPIFVKFFKNVKPLHFIIKVFLDSLIIMIDRINRA